MTSSILLLHLYIVIILLSYVSGECGKISGPDSKGVLRTIDVSSLPRIKWSANLPAEYEIQLCQNSLSCKEGQHTILQYWENQCFYLGKAEQTSMRLLGKNIIFSSPIVRPKRYFKGSSNANYRRRTE
jgi:hypothetical protein